MDWNGGLEIDGDLLRLVLGVDRIKQESGAIQVVSTRRKELDRLERDTRVAD